MLDKGDDQLGILKLISYWSYTECRKTQAEEIGLVNHSKCKSHNEPIRTQNKSTKDNRLGEASACKRVAIGLDFTLKAILLEAIFLATCLARKISRVTPHFCNLQRQQNVALRFARKVEISSTFRNVARQVAACDISIATGNTILWK